MKYLALILSLTATTASADMASELANCYYRDGLRSQGVDPDRISPSLAGDAAKLRRQLQRNAEDAVELFEMSGEAALVNLAVSIAAAESNPELGRVFISCNNRILVN